MKALVTGGAGFIGSHLAARLLDRGYEVLVVDNLTGGWRDNIPDGATFYSGELSDPPEVDYVFLDFEPDLVFHFAAYAAVGLSHWVRRFNYENNLIASVNLINAALEYGCERFVFASSMSVYGDGDENQMPPFSEDLTPVPDDPYAVAKYAVEMDLRIAPATHGLDYTIIRPHNVYGENQNLGDPYRNVVGIFMRQAMAGEPLTVYGDGLQRRAYSYIADIIDPIIDAATLPAARNEIFNLGGDTVYTILDLVAAIEVEFGPVEIRYLPTRYEVRHAWSDHDKAKDLLGFSPTVELPEGMARMANWAQLTGVRWSETPPVEVTDSLPAYWRDLG